VIFALVALIFTAHLSYFAINVPPLELEVMWLGRAIACVCAVLSLFLLSRVITGWTGDAVVGASASLALLLFPSTAFVYALSVPIALLVFLFLLGVWLATVADGGARTFVPLVIGGIAAALPFLAVAGFYLSVVLLTLTVIERPPKRFLVMVGGATVLSVSVLSLAFPMTESANRISLDFWSLPVLLDGAVLVDWIVRPYAMLWLGLAFSLFGVLGSRPLRQRICSVLARRLVVIAIVFCFAVIGLAAGYRDASTDLSRALGFNALLPLGVMLTLPMVLWIRFVMPQIKSVWIWILLPVVMYSCFWVVLGAIDLGAFPYDQVASPAQR
jgi:hypothetical protein